MKTCVRPAMCKPYGKQSEALQKSMYLHLYLLVPEQVKVFTVHDTTYSVAMWCAQMCSI